MLFKVSLFALTLVGVVNAHLLNSSSLGPRSHHEHEVADNRIVGGSAAEKDEFPYFVSWNGCAASLIAEDVVLSAAHCNGIESNRVVVGAYQKWWNQLSGDAEVRTISERRVHPGYSRDTFANDFLVMKLNEPITTIKPVVLNGDIKVPVQDEVLTVIGFGAVFEGGWGSRLLQKVDVKYVSHEQCNTEYDGDIVEDVMLCAGVTAEKKDSCQGDSGGPIMKRTSERDIQVGVVSWGFGCGRDNFSGVYSRISGAMKWIDQQVCELSGNPPPRCFANISESLATAESFTDQTFGVASLCSDSENRTFVVDNIHGMQGCLWLKEAFADYGYLCKFVDVATSCPKLCNICSFMGT